MCYQLLENIENSVANFFFSHSVLENFPKSIIPAAVTYFWKNICDSHNHSVIYNLNMLGKTKFSI